MAESDSEAPKPDEGMPYGMLGCDSSSQEDKLAKYTGNVSWEYLEPHFKAGALLFVDPEISLEDAGRAFTDDDSDSVQSWLKRGDLVKIEAIHVAQWKGTETEFEAVVVSPFVLCRPRGDS